MREITVFTPTYNRAYIIKNVYNSLVRQTYKDFEWLVIDDGSVDNTSELIQEFIDDNKIEIYYWKKENGGQHTALNIAIEKARGKLLMIVDSDDYLTDNALERIVYWNNTIKEEKGFAGVSGLRIYPNGKSIGTWKLKDNFVDATNFEREKLGLMGDKAEAYYTDVLREYYPIPVFEGENDVEKAVLWNRIAYSGLKVRWFNEGIYICEYLEDGMTRNIQANYLKNFQGFTCWKKELIDMQKSYLRVIAQTAAYTDIAREKGLSIRDMAKVLDRKCITVLLAKIYLLAHDLKRKLHKG